MKFIFGIFSLFIATIGAFGPPKIEIYEIRENRNGIELKNLNSNPKNIQRADPLLKLLKGPKFENQAANFGKKLLGKLKSLKGDDKTARLGDDTHIYILNSDMFDDDSSEESLFVDQTRNDRPVVANRNIDTNDLKDIVMKILSPDRKVQRKRKLRQKSAVKKPVLRASDIYVLDERPANNRELADEYNIDPNVRNLED
ncbi:uncharacterized protein LOC110376529 [Helicoverpa armigera]|uniref:uncharacterized protein LOC110376529 n=1 Tax=Helicoverpa armigera TaxID=29058 RepID=UPI0030839A2B